MLDQINFSSEQCISLSTKNSYSFSRLGVRINGVGAFVVVVFPGAYVDLPVDPLTALPPWRRLRILCGGVWHNLVIAAVAWALLASNPVRLTCKRDLSQAAISKAFTNHRRLKPLNNKASFCLLLFFFF